MSEGFLLYAILAVAGLGSTVLVAVSTLALVRRRSISYLLVTLAIGTLLFRSVLGSAVLGDLVAVGAHHLLEHVLDALVVVLLFAAICAARRVDPQVPDLDAIHD